MKYIEFKNKFADLPIINISTIKSIEKNVISLKNNINKWVKKEYLYKLKNNLYILNKMDRKIQVNSLFVANNLYFPSYISLEYALFYYGLIPETVYEITSITTLKTRIFENILGRFSYSSIKKDLFWGIKTIKDENNFNILIATPEKAILDFFYFRYFRYKKTETLINFINKNRFQNLSQINKKVFKNYLKKYDDKFKKSIKDFMEIII